MASATRIPAAREGGRETRRSPRGLPLDPRLRAALEARLAELRREREGLEAVPARDLAAAVDALLSEIDDQQAEWQVLAPDLLTGDDPADESTVPAQCEVLRAMRKLAWLRAKVLAASRDAPGRSS